MSIYESGVAGALESVASHEQICRFHLLPDQFTADRGNDRHAKLRRRAIYGRYREILESLYTE